MKKSLKNKWIEALLSGNYEQGAGSLCTKEAKYCCIGVLVEEAKGEGVWEEYEDTFGARYAPGYHGGGGMVNDHFLFEVGLNPKVAKRLVAANDTGVPFASIASIIEREVGEE